MLDEERSTCCYPALPRAHTHTHTLTHTHRRQGTTAFPLLGLSDAAGGREMAAADHQGREGGREGRSGGRGEWGGKRRLDGALQLAQTQERACM